MATVTPAYRNRNLPKIPTDPRTRPAVIARIRKGEALRASQLEDRGWTCIHPEQRAMFAGPCGYICVATTLQGLCGFQLDAGPCPDHGTEQTRS